MNYLFLLGRNKELSLAELEVFFEKKSMKMKRDAFVEISGDLSGFAASPQKFLSRLGGTIKILEIVEEKIPASSLESTCEKILENHFEGKNGKWKFGLSIFPEADSKKMLRPLLLSLKKNLKLKGGNARFVNKNFENVSNVTVWNEKLFEAGLDLTLVKENLEFLVAKTLAVQDYKSYGLRDFEKPFRDPKAGMLPPKLAQIMINLAVGPRLPKSPAEITVVDPFCGTGTILMEALLMGYQAHGFDRSEKMVEGAKKNLEWFAKKIHVDSTWKIEKKDATLLTQKDIPEKCAIVTESSLGPPLSKFPPPDLLKKISEEVEALTIAFFKNLRTRIAPGTPIVITFPYFRNAGGKHAFLDSLVEKVTRLGYSKTDFALSQRGTLLYDRPDQVVGREIIKFIPE